MSVAEGLFRAFLGTCPPEFRRNYGPQAVEVFIETLKGRKAEGRPITAWLFVLFALGDILVTSIRERAGVIGSDVAYALRLIAKSWEVALIVVGTLAIAIGICATVLSAIDAVLITPLPYQDAHRLVLIFDRDSNDPNAHGSETSLPNTQDWLKLAHSFSAIGSFANWLPARTDLSSPAVLAGHVVTAGFFEALGVRPRLGRLFTESDFRPGARHTVVISESYWRHAFASSSGVIGRNVSLNDITYTIVGVLPDDFAIPEKGAFGETKGDVYRALATNASPRNSHYLITVARLAPGVTAASAQADMNRVASLLGSRFPVDARIAQHVIPLETELFGPARLMLAIAAVAVVGILLIACLNVTNILIARIAERERELAIRLAVGASRRRLVVQLLIESAVFAFLGGLFGLVFSALLIRLVSGLGFAIPRLADARVSPFVLLVTLAVTALCAIAIGTAPALTVSGTRISAVLKDTIRGGSNARGKLVRSATVVLELALALALVAGSALLVRSFVALASVHVGFDYDDVVASDTILLPLRRYRTPASQLAFAHALAAGLEALPDLHSPGLMVSTPLSNENYNAEEFRVEGRPQIPGHSDDVEYNAVTAGGLDSLRLHLLRGRLIDARDTERSAPVAVVTKAFALKTFPDSDPIGQRVVIAYGTNPSWGRTIVGIVDDFKMESLTEQPLPQIIVPLYQDMATTFQIVARSRANHAQLATEISSVVQKLDRKLPARRIRSYSSYISGQLAGASTAAWLLAFMACIAFLLATIGTYGVVSYNVGQRIREFGIRRALGASTSAIVSDVLLHALLLAGIGVILGLCFSVACSRAIANLLYGVSPLDPATFASVAAALLTVAAGAALAPALHAARSDPATILRHE